MRRLLAAVLALGATVLVLAGCSLVNAGRPRASVDVCAPALVVAQGAAGTDSHLRSIRRLTLPEVNSLLSRAGAPAVVRPTGTPSLPSPTTGPSLGDARLCAFVFGGAFAQASLSPSPSPAGQPDGRGLLLVVTVRRPHVVAQAVVDQPEDVR